MLKLLDSNDKGYIAINDMIKIYNFLEKNFDY